MIERVRHTVLSMPMAQTPRLAFRMIDAGYVELEIPLQEPRCIRSGQLQATAVFAAADFAAVAVAGTLLPPGFASATIDASLKLVAPAFGSRLVARGRVVKASRSLTVCASDAYAVCNGKEILCATMLDTTRNIDTAAAP